MLKNMLLASAAAFVVLGAAASLTNMKAVITSGNGADAALTRDAFDLSAQLRDLRDEQVRQATLLSVQDTTIRRLQRDLARADKVALMATPDDAAGDTVDVEGALGLAMPTLAAAETTAAYHAAWLQAMALDGELTAAQAAYRQLEAATGERLTALESATAARVATLQRDHKFALDRLEAEIEQRDSSIVGLMHRIVSMQTGSGAEVAARPASPVPAATPPAASPARPAVQRAPATPPVDAKPADAGGPASAAPGTGGHSDAGEAARDRSVAAGVAAYHEGDYRKAFAIWRVLANDGDSRARFHLGALYYEGRGVERQLETAQVLLAMAAADGHEGAIALRDKVAAELAGPQVARTAVGEGQ